MSFARGLFLQFDVVRALVLRETRTRFGAHQLGYLWAILEPLISILTFYVLFRAVNRPSPPGMDLFVFLATGFVPYALFSTTATNVANAINGNKALLFYPHVRPLDLVFARSVLEAATYSAVFVVLVGSSILHRQHFEIDSALVVVFGFVLASLLGATVGLVFCALGQFSNLADRVRGPMLRPLFWLSGLFFTADQLPDRAREALLHNPLLHTIELIRDGWYPSHTARHADARYVLAWILILAFVGLTLERVVRRRIELHMIELHHITKTYRTLYGPNVVLDDISFRIAPRESMGVLGPNGAGKSTLLRIICGIEMPDFGEVIRRGTVSSPIGLAGGFNGSLTGEENCRFVARIYGQDVDRVVDEAREFAEIGDYFYMPVRTYSSGMRARLAFGVSMTIDFDVYLADEITAVGDKRFRRKCQAAFAKRKKRSTLVMVSHQLDTLKQYCQRCALLEDGKLRIYDTVDEAAAAYDEGSAAA